MSWRFSLLPCQEDWEDPLIVPLPLLVPARHGNHLQTVGLSIAIFFRGGCTVERQKKTAMTTVSTMNATVHELSQHESPGRGGNTVNHDLQTRIVHANPILGNRFLAKIGNRMPDALLPLA